MGRLEGKSKCKRQPLMSTKSVFEIDNCSGKTKIRPELNTSVISGEIERAGQELSGNGSSGVRICLRAWFCRGAPPGPDTPSVPPSELDASHYSSLKII